MNESSSSDAFFEPFEKSASEVLLRLKNEKLTEKEVEENQGIHRIEAFIFELQTTKLQFQKGLINRNQAIRLISQAARQWATFDVPEKPSAGETL